MAKKKSGRRADALPILHIRNSERGKLKLCPQQWWWAYRDGLKSKEPAKALWFGEGIHLALAHYYAKGRKRRNDLIDVWLAFADDEAEFIRTKSTYGADEDQLVDARRLGESMLREYVKEYQGDPNWDVIATEQSFKIDVPYFGKDDRDTPQYKMWERAGLFDAYGEWFEFNGTFDGVYRDKHTKKLWLMEHKTAGTISTAHLPLDDQAGSYWAVASQVLREQGVLGPRDNIAGITYNFLRKAFPDERPKDADGYARNKPVKEHYVAALRDAGVEGWAFAKTLPQMMKLADDAGLTVLGEISKRQESPLFQREPVKRSPRERARQIRRIAAEMREGVMYRAGLLEVIKNPTRECTYGCPFMEMCQLHEQGVGWDDFKDSVYRVEDPYINHRKSA